MSDISRMHSIACDAIDAVKQNTTGVANETLTKPILDFFEKELCPNVYEFRVNKSETSPFTATSIPNAAAQGRYGRLEADIKEIFEQMKQFGK